MTTIIINEKTKAGRSLVEFLKNSGYATIVDQSPAIESILRSFSELEQVKKGKLKVKSARKLADEL